MLGHDGLPRRASELRRPRFAFVRHPLDRLVSMWRFASQPEFLPLIGGRLLTFEEFVRADIRNSLTLPQTYWLDAPVDFVGRFERLADDWAQISVVPLPHLNASSGGGVVCDDDLLRLIESRYAEDYERLGYERLFRQ